MDAAVLKIYQRTLNATEYVVDTVALYVDLGYLRWILWVLYPLIITFLLPFLIFLFVYASAFFLHIYRLRHILRAAYQGDIWAWARKFLAAMWDAQGTIWHGTA